MSLQYPRQWPLCEQVPPLGHSKTPACNSNGLQKERLRIGGKSSVLNHMDYLGRNSSLLKIKHLFLTRRF